MKNKKTLDIIKAVIQCISVVLIIFWLYSYLCGYYINSSTSFFYKWIMGFIIITSFATAIMSQRWWWRLIWSVVALFFVAFLVAWIGWDMNKFQF